MGHIALLYKMGLIDKLAAPDVFPSSSRTKIREQQIYTVTFSKTSNSVLPYHICTGNTFIALTIP